MQLAYSSRVWNETPIRRRTTDGYVNATAMCKANGKRWSDYRESDRCQRYLDALSELTEIPVVSLYQSVEGRNGGTYVHPQVAVDLARWISAPFAVWMDGWFIEEMQAKAEPVSQVESHSVLSPQETLDLIERSMGLLDRLEVMDDRDRLQFGDMVRSVAAKGAGGLLLPVAADDEEFTLSDAWLEVTGQPLPRSQGPALGRIVAELYRENFDSEPPTRTQWVDGAPRKVKSYKRGCLISAVESLKHRLLPSKAN